MSDSILTVYLQKMAGETLDRIINIRPELQFTWRPGVEYGAGAYVRPMQPNGFDYQASIGGRTENIEPRWPIAPGGTVTDGSITWTCKSPTQSSLDPLSGSASIVTQATGNTIAIQGTDPNGDITVRIGGGATNTDYVNVIAASTVAGQVINVRVVTQIRG